jgi:hypothetical protein
VSGLNVSNNSFMMMTSLVARIPPQMQLFIIFIVCQTTEIFGCDGSHGLLLLEVRIVIVWNSN